MSEERSISPTAPIPKDENTPDLSKLTPQELRIYKLYGKLPSKNDILGKKLKDRKYFDSGDYALNKIRSQQKKQKQQEQVQQEKSNNITNISETSSSISSSSSSTSNSPGSMRPPNKSNPSFSGSNHPHPHISGSSSTQGSPKKIPDDDFITSSVDNNSYLPLPNVEKIMDLQKKKSITRNGSIISTTNKAISGISSKSNLETEVDSDDIK